MTTSPPNLCWPWSSRARLLAFLRDEVGSWRRRAAHVSLFGSAARGDGDTRSDLDLLVVRPDDADDERWEAQLYETGTRILAATGNRAAWFSTTPGRPAAGGQDRRADHRRVRRDTIHLAGRRLEQLLREAA